MTATKSIFELMNLRDRVAVVTGSSGGIGQAICSGLAELGCDLVLIDRDLEKLKSQAAELAMQFDIKVKDVCIDLEDESQRASLPEQIRTDFLRLDILINNAAFVGDSSLTGWAVPLEQQEIATWRRALEVNLTACFHLGQMFAPTMKKEGVGSIVNIGSIYGVGGPDLGLYAGTEMGNPAAYAASKGGLIQLTRWMSTVMAPEIRVNCVSPGGVFRGQPEKFVERYVARTPLGRMATEEDFIGSIVFLTSDMSRYVTGQNIMVDGGWTAW